MHWAVTCCEIEMSWFFASNQTLQTLFDHEVVTLRTCVNRQQLFGREEGQAKLATTLGLESTSGNGAGRGNR